MNTEYNTVRYYVNCLIDFFRKSCVFDLEKDFDKVITISLNKELDRGLLIAALKQLNIAGILVPIGEPNEKNIHIWWALTKPLEEFRQTVEVGAATVISMSQLINKICEVTGDKEYTVDPLNIQEKDIRTLVGVCYKILESHEATT